jgi:Arc/MetJ-type ribon-helix-helix transcriptional regulator
MAKSIKVNQKKRGRPATGRDPVSAVRLPAALTAVVDEWAQNHEANRSEAIRRLVELGLTARTKTRPTGRLRAAVVADLAAEAIDSLGPKVKTKAKQPSTARAARAKELAATAIDKMIDPAAPPEERAQRRRRLTKGPLEFREARVDQPKAKNGRNK